MSYTHVMQVFGLGFDDDRRSSRELSRSRVPQTLTRLSSRQRPTSGCCFIHVQSFGVIVNLVFVLDVLAVNGPIRPRTLKLFTQYLKYT
jgi:hypothetical protein